MIYTNISTEDYDKIDCIRVSHLAAGLVGTDEIDPMAMKKAIDGTDQKERTAAQQDRLDRGTLAHLLLMQPELVAESVAVWRGGKRQGAEYDAWCDQNQGKIQFTARDYAHVTATVATIMRECPQVSEMLAGLDYEVALNQEWNGLLMKGRTDAIKIQKRLIVDVKTLETDTDRGSVKRNIREWHYREKMALYRQLAAIETGTDPEEWKCYLLYIGIGQRPGVRKVKLSSGALEWGLYRMRDAVQCVHQCQADGRWPMMFGSDVVDVDLWEMPVEEMINVRD